MKSFPRGWPARIASVFLLTTLAIAVVSLVYLPHDPLTIDLSNRFAPPFWSPQGNFDHPLGTDELGRDVLSRMIMGVRISLQIAIPSAVGAAVVGTLLGLFAGYIGGTVDVLLMRLVDVLTAVPLVVIGVAVLGVFGGGIVNLSLLLVLFSWGEYARVVRSQTLAVKEQEYVMAAQTLGATGSRVVFRHILPSVLALTIVVFTLQLPHLIILESGLSFLGVGVRPPTPSLGNIIAEARSYLEIAWWVAAVPGIWLSLIVLSANIFGDWLRDIADPRMRGLVATQVGR